MDVENVVLIGNRTIWTRWTSVISNAFLEYIHMLSYIPKITTVYVTTMFQDPEASNLKDPTTHWTNRTERSISISSPIRGVGERKTKWRRLSCVVSLRPQDVVKFQHFNADSDSEICERRALTWSKTSVPDALSSPREIDPFVPCSPVPMSKSRGADCDDWTRSGYEWVYELVMVWTCLFPLLFFFNVCFSYSFSSTRWERHGRVISWNNVDQKVELVRFTERLCNVRSWEGTPFIGIGDDEGARSYFWNEY